MSTGIDLLLLPGSFILLYLVANGLLEDHRCPRNGAGRTGCEIG